ncbi:hypothetical protein NDU88_006191 [Pleurodeles waltl]|uniref:Uncharacterized protein n=1 Tax=Pleurodeles waltl TaxID=8319 RepID=A0AAV7MF33_PLEWA|nr:hypothetical protein NDU88_006191 [Pleurodeles waltl]
MVEEGNGRHGINPLKSDKENLVSAALAAFYIAGVESTIVPPSPESSSVSRDAHLAQSLGLENESCPLPSGPDPASDQEEVKNPGAHSFLEALFACLWDDFQTVKKDLSKGLREIRCYLDMVEDMVDRVSALGEHEMSHDEEIEQLHQEIIRPTARSPSPC